MIAFGLDCVCEPLFTKRGRRKQYLSHQRSINAKHHDVSIEVLGQCRSTWWKSVCKSWSLFATIIKLIINRVQEWRCWYLVRKGISTVWRVNFVKRWSCVLFVKKKLDKGWSANCTRLTKAWIYFAPGNWFWIFRCRGSWSLKKIIK